MLDTIFGLPTHVLVIHASVVLVPLAAVGAVLFALVPRWRRVLRWPVIVVGSLGAATVPVAILTGRELEERLRAQDDALVQQHEEWGTRALWVVVVWWLVMLAVLWWFRASDARHDASHAGSPGRLVALGALVAVSILAIGAMVVTGHSGSTAVWQAIVENT